MHCFYTVSVYKLHKSSRCRPLHMRDRTFDTFGHAHTWRHAQNISMRSRSESVRIGNLALSHTVHYTQSVRSSEEIAQIAYWSRKRSPFAARVRHVERLHEWRGFLYPKSSTVRDHSRHTPGIPWRTDLQSEPKIKSSKDKFLCETELKQLLTQTNYIEQQLTI